MKKYITLAALLATGSALANADSIVLDSGMIKDSTTTSLYANIVNGTSTWNGYNSGTYTTAAGVAFTFYIDVDQLFGASALSGLLLVCLVLLLSAPLALGASVFIRFHLWRSKSSKHQA